METKQLKRLPVGIQKFSKNLSQNGKIFMFSPFFFQIRLVSLFVHFFILKQLTILVLSKKEGLDDTS